MISADYVRGFVDGEGCFYILTSQRIACEFQVSQKSKGVLEEIQCFFGCGYIKRKYDKSGTYVYVVKDVHNLFKVIVPFFKENPLVVKREQFSKFSRVVELQYKKLHLTKQGKEQIARIKMGTSETIR